MKRRKSGKKIAKQNEKKRFLVDLLLTHILSVHIIKVILLTTLFSFIYFFCVRFAFQARFRQHLSSDNVPLSNTIYILKSLKLFFLIALEKEISRK